MTEEEIKAEEWSRTCFRIIPFKIDEVRKLCKKSYLAGLHEGQTQLTEKDKQIEELEELLAEQYPDLKQSLDWANEREKELEAYNKKLLQSDIDKHNKISLLSEKVNVLQKKNAELEAQIEKLEDKLANADYQLEGRDNEIRYAKSIIKSLLDNSDEYAKERAETLLKETEPAEKK